MVKRRKRSAVAQESSESSLLGNLNDPSATPRMDVGGPKQGLEQPGWDSGENLAEDTEEPEKDEEDPPTEKKKRKRNRIRKKKGSSTAGTSTTPAASADSRTDTGGLDGDSENLRSGINDTVYVEGIPWTCNEDDVQEFFKDCGKITAVRMPRWQDSGRSRGYAHVAFAGSSGAREALGLDGQYLKGRYLSVQKPQEPATEKIRRINRKAEHPPGCRTVFIKNLPYDADEDGVHDALANCGRVASVRLAMWNHTRKLKGFGYVEFVSEKGAETCVRTQESLSIGGRPLVVDFETGVPKGSFRRQDGAQIKKTSVDAGVGRGKPPKFRVHV